MRSFVRQGDVLLERVDALPKGLKAVERDDRGRVVLQEGEVTGHAHAILEPNAVLYEAERVAARYLEVLDAPVVLRHEEHGAIVLEPGVYRQHRQREYFEGRDHQVVD